MTKKEENQALFDEYMESVNDMQEAETDPFFYTRVYAKMQKQPGWNFPLRPAWIVAGLTLLLLLNGFIVINKFTSIERNDVSATTSLQNFATAYDLTIQSTY